MERETTIMKIVKPNTILPWWYYPDKVKLYGRIHTDLAILKHSEPWLEAEYGRDIEELTMIAKMYEAYYIFRCSSASLRTKEAAKILNEAFVKEGLLAV